MRTCLDQVGLWHVCSGIVLFVPWDGKTHPECGWHQGWALKCGRVKKGLSLEFWVSWNPEACYVNQDGLEYIKIFLPLPLSLSVGINGVYHCHPDPLCSWLWMWCDKLFILLWHPLAMEVAGKLSKPFSPPKLLFITTGCKLEQTPTGNWMPLLCSTLPSFLLASPRAFLESYSTAVLSLGDVTREPQKEEPWGGPGI